MRLKTIILLLTLTLSAAAQDLQRNFLNPPQEARPRVWWHWMDGNITRDGIRKDLEWMNRVGIGGFHCFEAGLGLPPIVENRLVYMSPEWQDHFRYAVNMADSMGMEVAIASCPGWSNTGGPWVKPEQAMKRLVWTEKRIRGGKRIQVQLDEPLKERWYKDISVLAVRVKKTDKTMDEMGAIASMSAEGEEPFWVQYELKKPQTVKALSIVDGNYRGIWAALKSPVTKYLEVSDDGQTFCRVCGIPHGSISLLTTEIPPTKARFFRIVFDRKPPRTPEWQLFTVSKINHAEEKAGYASPVDMMEYETTATQDETIGLSDIVDVTPFMDSDGHFAWKAPKGNWRIIRFGYTLTGKENHPASKEATGLEVTKLDKDAFTSFLEYYLDTYKQATQGLMGERGLHYLLIDSYEAGWETWTPRMAEEFQKRRGYSLLPWMPVLTGQIVESAAQSEEFLFDWRTTIGELIEECMYENAARIARKYGLETYFESHENGRLYLVDGMSAKSKADIPMAAMWAVTPGEKAMSSNELMAQCDIRESASVAHLYGRKYVACESMTVSGDVSGAYQFYPGNLKPTADLEMASGVNRFVIHESAHQPLDDKRPGLGLMQYGQWFNRHETWAEQARAWTDYLARSSYLLQQGQNVADILYYYGEDDVVTNMFAHQHPLIPAGFNFDYLNKESLLELISFDGQYFVTPAGARYRVLVLSDKCRHMCEAVQQKLSSLRQQGGPIIKESLQPMADALKNLSPDISATDMRDLYYVHRSTDEGEIYWLNNRRDEPRTIDVCFRVSGLKPMLWRAETGQMEEVGYEIRDGKTSVHLELLPYDAVFVVFSEKAEATKVELPKPKEVLLKTIDTPWTVQFDEEWGGPKETTFNHLISYTDSDDKGIRYYSGTAVYKNTLQLSKEELQQGRLVLDLGEVGCMAQVFVNGKEMGTLWKAPYKIDITEALVSGDNQLEIHVINQWVNRIIGDRQPDCEHPYTYTPRQFYRADSPLLPAGLMGPVRITKVTK
ncbi:MAG: glycoside hydrolase family 2 [Prevotella sp.]|nr:glycoside hydrolase family 2 [Prevotella sp.]